RAAGLRGAWPRPRPDGRGRALSVSRPRHHMAQYRSGCGYSRARLLPAAGMAHGRSRRQWRAALREDRRPRGGTMKKGYWIGLVDVGDPEEYKAYVAANAVAFDKYGARFVV